MNRNRGKFFFSLFFGLSTPVLARSNSGKWFFNFLIFFTIFFWNFHALVGNEQSSGLKIFSLFLDLSHPVLAKNNARKRFFNFLNFLAIFFSEFSSPGRLWTEIGAKFFFSLFFGLSTPVLAKNNSGKRFFDFLTFFSIFFEIFLPGPSMNGIWDWKFFPLSRPISSRFD